MSYIITDTNTGEIREAGLIGHLAWWLIVLTN